MGCNRLFLFLGKKDVEVLTYIALTKLVRIDDPIYTQWEK